MSRSAARSAPKDPKRASTEREAKLPEKNRKHLADTLRAYIDARHDGNQTAFARAVNVPPGTVSQLLSAGGTRAAGIVVLIRLRNHMRVSIDDLLGLEPMASASSLEEQQIRQIVREEVAFIKAGRDSK